MRKKSHISLARYIVKNTDNKELQKHRLAFYIGSILPDCKPSFLYKKHEIDGTFHSVEKAIFRLTGEQRIKNNHRAYCRNLGQITHYVADYFTFPHNDIYPGSLKDHCSYEECLKKELRQYLKNGEADRKQKGLMEFQEPKEIGTFILKEHAQYLNKMHRQATEVVLNKKVDVNVDIEDIVRVNRQAVAGILAFLKQNETNNSLSFDINCA